MPENIETPEARLDALSEILESGTVQQIKRMTTAMHPAELGDLLESVPNPLRRFLWQLVDTEIAGQVLLEVGDEVRNALVEEMDSTQILQATEGLDLDDLADFVQSLPDTLTEETLAGMDNQNRQRLEAVLSYPADTAGGLMDLDVTTVRANVSLDVVLRFLRRKGNLPDHTDQLIVVSRFDRYLGVLPVQQLLTSDPDQTVSEVMDREFDPVLAEVLASDVARQFEDRDLVSAPVVDASGNLLGRITIDDIVDVIRDEGEHSVMSMAGLSEEDDIFAAVIPSARRRAIWLGVNLLTALLASWVIGQFAATLEKLVALAVLMPIVASMGGIAGSQTLTLVIRGQALGQVGRRNRGWLLLKELAVGLLNGLFWATIVALITILWFDAIDIGMIIAAAMLVNLAFAASAGVIIPIMLNKVGVDPALAGGVMLTTVTDVVGFFTFLGLASWLLVS